MNISPKLLIDVEKENNIKGYHISKDGKEIQCVMSGKMIVTVPEYERTNKIYKLLKENCDLIFCTTENIDDFPFYPVPILTIFAVDSKGNCFGTIGGMGDIGSDGCPVGYIDQKGMHGKISGSIKEFLELVAFYPYWREIIKYEQMGAVYDIDDKEIKLAHQREIAETLILSKNPHSIELLISNIKSTPGFVVYNSINEAKITNIFLEDIVLDQLKEKNK